MLNIVLFGPPGSGKGTQSEKLISTYHLTHLSTGDILRGEVKSKTSLGIEAEKFMSQGLLVPDELVIRMIDLKIDSNPKAKGFVFDGFPRTTEQADALDNLLAKRGMNVTLMLALEVEDKELIKRLLNRGLKSGRSDDQTESVIAQRINEYNTKTAPLKDYYSNQGKFYSIQGTGTIEDIFNNLSQVILTSVN